MEFTGMRVYDLIAKKRDRLELSTEEIDWLIQSYTKGELPDYQMSAFLMAAYLNGLTVRETVTLTISMLNSGEMLDLGHLGSKVVDKHSTGGVGDTTSLVVGPMVAAAGCVVPKMSGRGLGHTGGTLDKLESIPGFKVSLSSEAFLKQVHDRGLAIISQTGTLAPADKKIYALRDATATVGSIPLIASSIMSKKLAAGAPNIVLDVKVGRGAFMKTLPEARELAHLMVNIGKHLQRKVVAVLTRMDYPLGYAIGNILEVKEAINILNQRGPADLTALCIKLGSEMLVASQPALSLLEAEKVLIEKLSNRQALHKLAEMVEAQGGDIRYVFEPERFPHADHVISVSAKVSGYISDINALVIGRIAMLLGAGRAKKGDKLDLTAGLVLHKQVGEYVREGEQLAEIHTNKSDAIFDAQTALHQAITISDHIPIKQDIVLEVIQ